MVVTEGIILLDRLLYKAESRPILTENISHSSVLGPTPFESFATALSKSEFQLQTDLFDSLLTGLMATDPAKRTIRVDFVQ